MNNWRAVGYIFLGFGSVFLSYALIVILSMMFSGLPILNQASVALAVNAPWLVLSALMYVVGFVGHYAGRETVTTSSDLDKDEPTSNRSYIWSFLIGVLAFLGILILQFALGFMNGANMLFGVFLPIFYSIIAGSIIGLVTYLIIDNLD